ncbi:MAG TPA: peptidoglycan-binding domain-containing protein [Acidimicrobiia bacterium]|nr:peptidoglycan-binding domain-containing protein [Acidimicrobiia bacterium]
MIAKNRALFLGLAAVILSSLVSWGAASRIRSPAEVAARTAPPTPSAITVPVERRVLSSDVVVRGTVRYGAPISVLLPASSIRKTNAILTSAPVKGKDLTEGSVAFTVSGRPAFVLQGAVPAYRDIGPGAVGDDVRQLQEALIRLGFKPGRTDGVYDDRTGLAVAAWYLKGGWTPSGPSEEQLAALRSAQADWFSAESDLLGAQEGLSAARHDYDIAQQKAAAAKGLLPPPATLTPSASSSGDSAAAARVEQERVSAAVRVAKARRAVAKANDDEKAAQARLNEARHRNPPPSNEEYAALAKQAQDASNRAAAARDELSAAEDAQNAINDNKGSSAGGHETPTASTVDPSAKVDAATAQAEALKAADAVAFAQRKVGLSSQRAGSGLSGTKLGIQIPAGEVLFFPALPARVDDVKLKVGDETTGPVMTVTSSNLVVESGLSAADAKLVKEGGAVAIKAPDSGVEATGTVTQIATTPGTNGVDPQRYYLEVTPNGLDVGLAGASVVQTISVQTTQGEVLAVPVAALSMASDGTTRVQVQPPRAPARSVTVEPGLAAKGLVAVTPVQGELGPGDLVVVGANNAGSSSAKGGKEKQPKGAGSGKK